MMTRIGSTNPQFTVAPVGLCRLADAYPLVRTFAPHVSLERWIAYATAMHERGGLLGLYGGSEAMFGLLSYQFALTLQHGRSMLIDNFVTFELSQSAPGRRALCEAAEALAMKNGCAAIELAIGSRGYADGDSAKARGWRAIGLELTGVVFRKDLDTADQKKAAPAAVL